jgi:hypothetical protein
MQTRHTENDHSGIPQQWGIYRIRADLMGGEILDWGEDEDGARARVRYLNTGSKRPVCYLVRKGRGGRWFPADNAPAPKEKEVTASDLKKEATRLLDYAAISEMTGYPVATIRMWANRGKVPPPDFRVANSPAWLPETIASWRNTFAMGAPERVHRKKAV